MPLETCLCCKRLMQMSYAQQLSAAFYKYGKRSEHQHPRSLNLGPWILEALFQRHHYVQVLEFSHWAQMQSQIRRFVPHAAHP